MSAAQREAERRQDAAIGMVAGSGLSLLALVAIIWTMAGLGVAVLALVAAGSAVSVTVGVGTLLEERRR